MRTASQSARLIALVAAILAAFLLGTPAFAQAVLQAGPPFGGHASMYSPGPTIGGPAVLQDSGPAGSFNLGQGLSEVLQVNRLPGTGPFGSHDCLYDQPSLTGPNGAHFLCLDANALGGGLLSYGALGGAAALPFNCDINNVVTPCFSSQNSIAFSVLSYGADNAGTTNASPAIMAAAAACGAAHGGWVIFPAGVYLIGDGLGNGATNAAWPANCSIIGTGGNLNFVPPFNNSITAWTNSGTWFHCADTTNPCLTISNAGSTVKNINWWWTQPTPQSATQCTNPCTFTHAWTPASYPYGILVSATANATRLDNINMVNATSCIDLEGPSSGISGVFTSITHSSLGCANTGIRCHLVDNTLYLGDVHHEMWWYQGSSDWWGYLEGSGSHADLDLEYCANPVLDGVEFAFSGLAIKLADGAVTSGFGTITAAVANLQGTNISFNEVCQAMQVQNATTHATGSMTNIIVAADTTTSQGPSGQCANQASASPLSYMFALNSDNVNFYLTGVQGAFAQGLATIGGGASGPVHGQLHLAQVGHSNYSAFRNGGILLNTDTTGSIVDASNLNWTFGSGTFTAGVKCKGSCAISSPYNEIAANLPTCSNSVIGSEIYITDLAAVPTYGTTVTTGSGGGLNRRLVACNGVNWVE